MSQVRCSLPISLKEKFTCVAPLKEIGSLENGDDSPPNERYFPKSNNCDSGFGTASDEDQCNSSEFSSEDGFDLKSEPHSLITNEAPAFDFWNKKSTKSDDNKHQSDVNKSVNSGVYESVTNCHTFDPDSEFLKDIDSFIDLLNTKETRDPSEFVSKSIFSTDSINDFDFVTPENKLGNNTADKDDSTVNLNELLNAISFPTSEKNIFAKNSKNSQNNLGNKTIDKDDIDLCELLHNITNTKEEKNLSTSNLQNDTSYKINESINSSDKCNHLPSKFSFNCDYNFSDLLASICSENDEDNSRGEVSVENKPEVASNFKLSSSENVESLSDLLASICVENNNSARSSIVHSAGTGKLNFEDSSLEDDDEISLASLAEQYLSSGKSDTFLTSSCNNYDSEKLLEKITLNTLQFPETNLKEENSPNCSNMPNLFANISKEYSLDSSLANESVTSKLDKKLHSPISSNSIQNYCLEDTLIPDDFEPLMNIDLTSCLKSATKQERCSDSRQFIKPKDKKVVQAVSDFNVPIYTPAQPSKNCVENFTSSFKNKKVNANESLLSKALSYKPRKDPSAMAKMLAIQTKFCKSLLNPQLPIIPTKVVKDLICPASEFVVSKVGRREFKPKNFFKS